VSAKTDIKSLYREELTDRLTQRGEASYRADQILEWTYGKLAVSFEEMTNLSAALRAGLAEEYEIDAVKALKTHRAGDTTEKLLFELQDHSLIETVLIPATPGLTSRSDRLTACVSTQVGCAFSCGFCASGLQGFKRDLTAAEIVDQVVHVQRISGERIDNIVVMGMGEPLANYDNLMRALTIINAPWGLGIGARKITVSTVGFVPRIKQLAEQPMQFRLAISLHGATDGVRDRLMPVNKKYPLKELIAACQYYRSRARRMITLEYILIDGVNDTRDQAKHLAEIAHDLRAKVNLIPYNEVEGLEWKRPDAGRCKTFKKIVEGKGVSATLRQEKGLDINAACGQLRLKHEQENR